MQIPRQILSLGLLAPVLLACLSTLTFAQDTCATAVLLGEGVTPVNLDGMTLDLDENRPGCTPGVPQRDIWFSFVPLTDSFLVISFSAASSQQPMLELFTGECGSLTRRAVWNCTSVYIPQTFAFGGQRVTIRLTDAASASTDGYLTITGGRTDRRIYVDADSPGGDGTSWSESIEHLGDALDIAARSSGYPSTDDPRVEVWVADGTYRTDESAASPLGSDDRSASFVLSDNVRIYGGFRGNETERSERALFDQGHISFLSGAIGPLTSIEDNAFHVVRAETSADPGSVGLLDGFTITSGNANVASSSSDDAHGGGVLAATGKCVIANCTLEFNESYWGGGGAAVRGGADATFANCRFQYNRSAGGGGLMIRDATGRAYQSLFLENQAAVFGGAIMAGPNAGELDIALATFVRNLAPTGAGMIVGSGTDVYFRVAMFHENSGFSGSAGLGSTARVNAGGQLYSNYLYAPDAASTISVASGGTSAGANIFDLADERPNFDLLFEDESNGNFRMGGNTVFAITANPGSLPDDLGDIDQDDNRSEPTPLDLMLGQRVVDGRVASSAFEPQGIATNFCTPLANASYPDGAELLLYGSQKVSDDNVILRVVGTPGSAGIFFVGMDQMQPVQVGQGHLCVSGPVRLPLATTVGDAMEYRLDLSSAPLQSLVAPGQRLYFQAWFRDSIMGAPTYNFSSGIYVDFE